MPLEPDTPQHEGPLAEFVALRAELQQRGEMQWRVMSLQITGSGAIFGFALSNSERVPFLLIVPVVSYIFGVRYAMHNHAIVDIAKYIRTCLSVRVPGGLDWEGWILDRRRSVSIGYFRWGSPNLMIFPGIGAAALVVLVAWPLVSNKWIEQAALTSVLEMLAWLLGVGLTATSLQIVKKSIPYRLSLQQ